MVRSLNDRLGSAQVNGPVHPAPKPMPAPKADGAPVDEEGLPALEVATIHDLIKAGAEVSWLWTGWLANGVLVAMAAEGGTGKTRFCADLVRRIRHKREWPDGTPISEALPADTRALWVVSDNHHDEMVTLCQTFGIVDNVIINAWKQDPYGGVSLEHDEDFKALSARIKISGAKLVIVDTVGNATDRNLSRQEDARAFYMPLQLIARKRRVCIICLTHLNAGGKFLGRRVMEKVRVAIKMEKPDPQSAKRSLEVIKTNSRKPDALGVTMNDDGNEYDDSPPVAPDPAEPGGWVPRQQQGGTGTPTAPKKGAGRPPAAASEAAAWLARKLADGRPLRVVEIRREMEAMGWGGSTHYAARDAVAIEEGEPGRLMWRLKPPPPSPCDDDDSPFP